MKNPIELEAVAKTLGFQNAELMLAYFTAKVMSEGLYEKLRAASNPV